MKKTIVFLLVTSAAMVSCAQNNYQSQVPSLVVNSFQQQFPNAKDVEWDTENGYFNVEFEIGRNDQEAWYDSAGKMVKLKQEIAYADLPAVVKDAIKRDYPNYRTDDVKKITEGTVITYKVEVERRADERVLLFEATGKLIESRID
jgi:hypothetical protein